MGIANSIEIREQSPIIFHNDKIVAKVPKHALRGYEHILGPVKLRHVEKKAFTAFDIVDIDALAQSIQKILEIFSRCGIKNALIFGRQNDNACYKMQIVPYIKCDIGEKMKVLYHVIFNPSVLVENHRNIIADFYRDQLSKKEKEDRDISTFYEATNDVQNSSFSNDGSSLHEEIEIADQDMQQSESIERSAAGNEQSSFDESVEILHPDTKNEKPQEEDFSLQPKDPFCKSANLKRQGIREYVVNDEKRYDVLLDHRPLGKPHLLIIPNGNLGHKNSFLDSFEERFSVLELAKKEMQHIRQRYPFSTLLYVERNGDQLRSVHHFHAHVINSPSLNSLWDRACSFLKVMWPAQLNDEELEGEIIDYLYY